MLASIAFAEPAEDAGLHFYSKRIGVRPAEIRGWLRVRMVAETFRALAKYCPEIWLFLRRVGIIARPRRLEWIPAGQDFSFATTACPASPREIPEPIVPGPTRARERAPHLDPQ